MAFSWWILFSFGFHVAVGKKFDVAPMQNLDKKGGIVTNINITEILQSNNITIMLLTGQGLTGVLLVDPIG